MVDRVLPVIPPEHYPAFQTLVAGLPATYDVWNAKNVEELQEAMRQGERLLEVVVYPDAFAAFLRAQGIGREPDNPSSLCSREGRGGRLSLSPAAQAAKPRQRLKLLKSALAKLDPPMCRRAILTI